MKHYHILIALFVLTSINAISQGTTDLSFLMNVAGNTKHEFSPKTIPLTSKFGLTEITDSKNDFELRLYETYSMVGISYCTLLSFDTIVKVSRIKCSFDPKNYKAISTEIISTTNLNPDSLLKVIVHNSLLNFPNESNERLSNIEYISKGVSELDRKIYFGGVNYIIEYKAGKKYNRLWWDNPQFYFTEHPNSGIFKIQCTIVAALGVGLIKTARNSEVLRQRGATN